MLKMNFPGQVRAHKARMRMLPATFNHAPLNDVYSEGILHEDHEDLGISDADAGVMLGYLAS